MESIGALIDREWQFCRAFSEAPSPSSLGTVTASSAFSLRAWSPRGPAAPRHLSSQGTDGSRSEPCAEP
jgi:hypothetical protein